MLGQVKNIPGLDRIAAIALAFCFVAYAADAADLHAGAAKADITNYEAGPVHDPLYAKALVVRSGETTLAIVTIDAVAIGAIGHIPDDFMDTLRTRLQREHGIDPKNVLVNASHCHGVVRGDTVDLAAETVAKALERLTPVRVGVGAGHEDRVSENRRFTLANGDQVDSRRAYALPPDAEFADVGPIDPEIGVLRLDTPDGSPLAVVYNFACHPIQGVPNGGNTADMTGIASQAIEDTLGSGAVALFVQGCAGDINPAHYKDVDHPHDANPLGNQLALSALRAMQTIETKEDARLTVVNENVELPRADFSQRIAALETKREQLLESLRGTSINLKTFIPLAVKYGLSPATPSAYGHRYLHEDQMEFEDLDTLDAQNRAAIERYTQNVYIMEELTRLQENLRLLRMHQQQNEAAASSTVNIVVMGVRIGEFVMVTFPGEPTVQIGLNIKKASPHEHTYVAGYTNGYIYYAATAEQLRNTGYAQEDCDTILAPEWQAMYERKVTEFLGKL